jgi:hypothetical protein
LYAELLDQLRAADAEAAVRGLVGTFVSKVIRGRTYWYLQRSEGSSKRQIYLGAESPELLRKIELTRTEVSEGALDERRRRELVTMLAAGGMFRESSGTFTVIRVLGDAAVFRSGGVLVGTQAFTTIGNLLGVTFEGSTRRTADVDIAHDDSIPIGLSENVDVLERLRMEEPRFVAVPGFDPADASTSLKVRGRDLRIDFVTPARRGSGGKKPVFLPHLGVAALPLEGLSYLIAGSVEAAFLGGAGVRVNVPDPARFALHKFWVAMQRPASERAKARKDMAQGASILEVLLADRQGDVVAAWEALGSLRKEVRSSMKSFDSDLARVFGEAVRDSALSRR